MKNLIAIAVVFASAKAMALSPRSSWSEIFKSRTAVASTQHATYMSGVDLDNACLTETTVQTIKPVSVCVKLVAVEHKNQGEGGDYTSYDCKQYAIQHVVRPRAYQVQVCTKDVLVQNGDSKMWECVQWGMKPVFIGGTVKADVRDMANEYSQSFEKAYTFPTCK